MFMQQHLILSQTHTQYMSWSRLGVGVTDDRRDTNDWEQRDLSHPPPPDTRQRGRRNHCVLHIVAGHPVRSPGGTDDYHRPCMALGSSPLRRCPTDGQARHPSSASAADRPEARREERLVETLHGGHRRRIGRSVVLNDRTPLNRTQPFTDRGWI